MPPERTKDKAAKELADVSKQRRDAQRHVRNLTDRTHRLMRELRDQWGMSNAEVARLAGFQKQNVFRILGPSPDKPSIPIDAAATGT